ncbi:MAG: small multi-drug export protein [Candidatus Pacebacteria bacterium]|nr:small multi-drug export protein [Candidatus Paceibacterota bacterium]
MISYQLQTLLIAMSPLVEFRGSIPIALAGYHLTPASAFVFSILGSIISAILIILFLEKISVFLSSHFRFFDKFFTWLFERTRKNNEKKFEKFKELAVFLMVAIPSPLPLTGYWTASLCAFLFGVSPKKSLPLIFLGTLIGGAIVLFSTMGIINLI